MRTTRIMLIILTLIFIYNSLLAQKGEVSELNNLYFGFEIGKSNTYDNYAQGGVWLQMDHHYFKISMSSASDNRSEEQRLLKGDENESYIKTPGLADLGLMYGKTYLILKHHQLQFGSGVAVVTQTVPDVEFNNNKQPYYLERFKEKVTVGLPVELKYAYVFKRGIGVGASWRANANSFDSYGNFTVGISMGLF
ncbi:MAG: hypothetical protein EOO47_18780 [Flavobacterium sp.]|nr:MAG: hypothetical protein EOO47_18780 [Flavobacterium sp.]